jgi:hypothetical protein
MDVDASTAAACDWNYEFALAPTEKPLCYGAFGVTKA